MSKSGKKHFQKTFPRMKSAQNFFKTFKINKGQKVFSGLGKKFFHFNNKQTQATPIITSGNLAETPAAARPPQVPPLHAPLLPPTLVSPLAPLSGLCHSCRVPCRRAVPLRRIFHAGNEWCKLDHLEQD